MRRSPIFVVSVLSLVWSVVPAPSVPVRAAADDISIDANAEIGMIQPTVVGQMMEWALPHMNEAWAEQVHNRSFETEAVVGGRGPLYDNFSGTSLDRSLWTPMSLDTADPGSIAVTNSSLSITASEGGRFGVMSNDLQKTGRHGHSVEARVLDYSGLNVILSIYGGDGAGDFDDFVEFAIEDGDLKVYADGLSTWTGGSVTTPANLRIDISPPELTGSGIQRDLDFYFNGSLVHSIDDFTQLPDSFRVFLYGWDGTVEYDWVTINPDDTLDAFEGTLLSSTWTPTRLAGSNDGSTSVSSGQLTITGGSDSRYGVLSHHLSNGSTDWTRISTRLDSVSGTNGLINIYGGSGAGDFSNFIEFGVEGGTAKVFTSTGVGNWTGGSVSLPATLDILVSPYYANGRHYQFFIDGTRVHSLQNRTDVPHDDYRVFLYGWGTSTTTWDHIEVSQVHMWDSFAPHFEGGPGLSVE